MRLVVLGAAGRTGRLLVERALAHGHEVTAFLHTRGLDLSHPRLKVVTGDALEFADVSAAVVGHVAVAVAVGGSAGVHERVIGNVVHAMATHEVTRLAVLSAAGTFARTDPHIALSFRLMMATALRATYDDLEAMERRVMASDLDWTIVRAVGLVDAPATGTYRISKDGSILPKGLRISREDVAGVLLKALETDAFRRSAIVVAD